MTTTINLAALPKAERSSYDQAGREITTQHLRAFTEAVHDPDAEEKAKNGAGAPQRKPKRKQSKQDLIEAGVRNPNASRGLNAHGDPLKIFVCDVETTIDPAQSLRFGVYIVYAATSRKPLEHGLFYNDQGADLRKPVSDDNPAIMSRAEVNTLIEFGKSWRLGGRSAEVMALHKFIGGLRGRTKSTATEKAEAAKQPDGPFFRNVYMQGALYVGHNIPFDLARMASHWHTATGSFYGGFTMTMCQCNCLSNDPNAERKCTFHPNMHMVQLAGKKWMVQFAAPIKAVGKENEPSLRHMGQEIEQFNYTGRFLDTHTFGRALLGAGVSPSLVGMCEAFRVNDPITGRPFAKHNDEHGATLTPEYIDYAVRDVEATWGLYSAEMELYARHDLETEPWRIYSEAGIGKAYFKAMGVPPFLKRHVDFPKDMIGAAMSAYYGGRSEVRIRNTPKEVIYADAKSQYPTVNALMRMQELLLAERITCAECTNEIQALLNTMTPAWVLTKSNWSKLRVLVELCPDDDILPLRARYGHQAAAANIGINFVKSDIPTWYTLPDVIASALLTGKAPVIMRAVRLVPHGLRGNLDGQSSGLKPKALFGDERYSIDLANGDDLFARVIDLRTTVKAEIEAIKSFPEAERNARADELLFLGSLQNGLKLIANATSYGALVEFVPHERETQEKVQVHTAYGSRTKWVNVVEEPGAFFAGPVGTFIPAAGRLMLALAERLALDNGIGHALCDTDSFVFARPSTMARREFQIRVRWLCRRFNALNPYSERCAIMELEDVNFPLRDEGGRRKGLMPMFALAVSAKRYVLYNRSADYAPNSAKTPRVRKFSCHATGDITAPGDYTSCAPDPCVSLGALGGSSGERWKHDLWWLAIGAFEAGATDYKPDAQAFGAVVMSSRSISSPHLAAQYGAIRDIRPGSFFTVFPGLNTIGAGRPLEAFGRTMFAPRLPRSCDTLATARATARFLAARPDGSGVHEAVPKDLVFLTIADRLRGIGNEPGYFAHPEVKSGSLDPKTGKLDAYGVGVLSRRRMYIERQTFMGKESNDLWMEDDEDTGGLLDAAGMPKLRTDQTLGNRTLASVDPQAAARLATHKAKARIKAAEIVGPASTKSEHDELRDRVRVLTVAAVASALAAEARRSLVDRTNIRRQAIDRFLRGEPGLSPEKIVSVRAIVEALEASGRFAGLKSDLGDAIAARGLGVVSKAVRTPEGSLTLALEGRLDLSSDQVERIEKYLANV